MRKKNISLIALITAACILLSGCSALSLNSSDLLAPPRAEGLHAGIQLLIESAAGGGYSLLYPAAGEYKSAVIYRDADGDGDEDAVAMFRDSQDVSHIMFVRLDGSEYSVVGDETLSGKTIERVGFCDLDGDSIEECYIIYPDGVSPLSSLSVISISDFTVRTDMNACCSDCVTGDFDGDGLSDIMILSLFGSASAATASLLSYSPGSLSIVSSCDMDPSLVSYSHLSCGNISPDTYGAFIDGCTAAGEYTTQIIYRDTASGVLVNPLLIYGGYADTRRTSPIPSADVDRDGIIEIPLCSFFDHDQSEDIGTVCRRVRWNSFDTDALAFAVKKTAVLCENAGFMFNISDSRSSAVTARYLDEDSAAIYVWEYKDNVLMCTDRLLTLNYYPKDAYDSGRIIEAVLAETNTGVYTYTIDSSGSYLSYTDEEVISSFVLTE